jgi:hypothetical protein
MQRLSCSHSFQAQGTQQNCAGLKERLSPGSWSLATGGLEVQIAVNWRAHSLVEAGGVGGSIVAGHAGAAELKAITVAADAVQIAADIGRGLQEEHGREHTVTRSRQAMNNVRQRRLSHTEQVGEPSAQEKFGLAIQVPGGSVMAAHLSGARKQSGHAQSQEN